jgi:hypothetical protein
MMASRLDPRDHELLQQIAGGEQVITPAEGEATDAPSWLQVVERLRRLRDRGLIRMSEPRRYFNQPGYPRVGPCELTADGWDLLERFGS